MYIFSDLINQYQLLDYSPTHNQLLVRSMKSKNRNHNVDIIIKGVLHIQIPTKFDGLRISIPETTYGLDALIEKQGFKLNRDYKIFLVEDSMDNKCYINAMCFGVYQNSLEILETSIGRYDFESLGENIMWYS